MKRSRRSVLWAGALALAVAWATPGLGGLTVEEGAGTIAVRSDRAPTWTMVVDKGRGAVKSLVIPADGGDEVVAGHGWANAFGRSVGYHDFARPESWQATNRNIVEEVAECRVVARSADRVVVAVKGAGKKDGELRYTFRQHLVFEPGGARTDLEIVNLKDDPWRCVQIFSPLWFRGGAVPDTSDARIRIWDADTPESRPEMKNTRTQDDFVPLPAGIAHPYSVRVPLVRPDGVSLVIREVAVPEKVARRNEWSLPLGFAQRKGEGAWGWWLTGGASPGAIKGNYDPGETMAPAGEPQVFAWGFSPTVGDAVPPPIRPHDPALPE